MSFDKLVEALGEETCEDGRPDFLYYLATGKMSLIYSKHVEGCGPCRLALENARLVFERVPVPGAQPFS